MPISSSSWFFHFAVSLDWLGKYYVPNSSFSFAEVGGYLYFWLSVFQPLLIQLSSPSKRRISLPSFGDILGGQGTPSVGDQFGRVSHYSFPFLSVPSLSICSHDEHFAGFR